MMRLWRDAPLSTPMADLVRRFLKAYSEAVYRLFTDKELSRRAIAKYTRAADAKTLDTVYQYAVDYVDKIPYNTREGYPGGFKSGGS